MILRSPTAALYRRRLLFDISAEAGGIPPIADAAGLVNCFQRRLPADDNWRRARSWRRPAR